MCGSQTDSSGSDSESEQDDRHKATDSPVSGTVQYFVPSADSSDTQVMMIEELNQVSVDTRNLWQEKFATVVDYEI